MEGPARFPTTTFDAGPAPSNRSPRVTRPSLSTGLALSVTGPARAAYADRIISRNDMVEVAYEVGGVRLTISGRAEGNAAAGQRLAVRNLQSGRTIDAVAVAPGQAMAGSAAQEARVSQQLAAR